MNGWQKGKLYIQRVLEWKTENRKHNFFPIDLVLTQATKKGRQRIEERKKEASKQKKEIRKRKAQVKNTETR